MCSMSDLPQCLVEAHFIRLLAGLGTGHRYEWFVFVSAVVRACMGNMMGLRHFGMWKQWLQKGDLIPADIENIENIDTSHFPQKASESWSCGTVR